jgi:hypothetical protein
MKRCVFAGVALLISLCLSFSALADSTILPLYSGVTGTTVQVSGATVAAPFIVSTAGCDILTNPTTTTVVLFKAGNALQTAGSYTFDSAGLATATTCTTGTCNVQFIKTFFAMQALVTTASSSFSTVKVNCAVR